MIKCVVIDDEQPARELIAMHVSALPDFSICATFDNALDGFGFLQKNAVDLLFLDIQMPRLSGLELMRSLRVCPRVILTTAHREFAADAFELDVVDYLVKPITQERFMKAISRFHFLSNVLAEKPDLPNSFEKAYIFLKTGKEQLKIYLKDILYVEGLKDFTKVHTVQKVVVASERLSYMEDKLPENRFVRVHKSYIIGLEKISSVQAGQVMIAGASIPVGRIFKNEFLRKWEAMKG